MYVYTDVKLPKFYNYCEPKMVNIVEMNLVFLLMNIIQILTSMGVAPGPDIFFLIDLRMGKYTIFLISSGTKY